MKSQIYILLISLFCLVQTTKAQSTFEKIFRVENQGTEVNSVFPLADGYMLLSQHGKGIINLTKLDANGNYDDGKDVFDSNSGFVMSASMTSTGNFLITGVAYVDKDNQTSTQTGFFLKVSPDLSSVLAYKMVPVAGNGDTWASGAIETSDGSILILAKSTVTSVGGSDHYFEIIKMNGAATQVTWQSAILAGNDNTVFDIAETTAGYEIYGAIKNKTTNWNLYLGTISKDGLTMKRQLIIGGGDWDGAYDLLDGAKRKVINNASSIVKVNANTLAVAAYTRSYGSNTLNQGEKDGKSILLVNYPVSGDSYNWTAILDGSANERLFGPFGAGNFISLSNGDLLLAGYTNSTGTETPYPGGFMYRFSANSDGTVTPRWQHVFTPSNNLIPLGLAETSDRRLMLAGNSAAATKEGVLMQTTADGFNPACCISANYGKLALDSITPSVRSTTNASLHGATLNLPYAETLSRTTTITTICSGQSAEEAIAPALRAEPESQTIASGQSATLSVLTTGTPPIHYQWYQGESGDTTTPLGADSSSFLTAPLTSTTSYWVKISNAKGELNSATATITVENIKWLQSNWTDDKQLPTNLTVALNGNILVTSQDVITQFGPDGWPCGTTPGYLTALDPISGSIKWSINLGHSAPPAVAKNGTVYTNIENRFYGINATSGAMKLIYTADQNLTSSPAVAADGMVYIGAGQKVLAIDPVAGKLIWEVPVDKFVIQHPTIGSDGIVYVIPWRLSSKLYAFYPQKTIDQLKWVRQIDGFFSTAPVIGTNGTIYAGAGSRLIAFQPASGTSKWEFTTPIAPSGYPAIKAITSEPVISNNGTIYFSALTFGSSGGAIYAIHPDGYPKWFFSSGSTVYTSPVLAKDKTIYYPADKLHVLDLSGKELWSKEDAGFSSPVLSNDGTIFGVSYNNNGVFALAGTSGGLAIGHWPAFGHDPQHTCQHDDSFVGIPPTIAVQPESQLIKSGQTATFTVAATGDPVISYQWFEGANGDRSKPVGSNSPSYTTPPLTRMTNYWVEAENTSGKDISINAMASTGNVSEVKWIYNTNPANDHALDGEIMGGVGLAKDGTLYFGIQDARLYAMKPDGTVKWITKVQAYSDQEEVTNTISYSTPVVGDDGTIYINTLGYYGGWDQYNFGMLWAINPDGSEKWRYETGNFKAGSGSMAPWLRGSAAIGHEGTIYVVSDDGVLHAVNPDGTPKWKFLAYENKGWLRGLDGKPPVVGLDGTIYFAAEGESMLFDMSKREARLFAINPDGSLKWDFKLVEGKLFASEYPPCIGPDGKIYVDNGDGTTTMLYVINPNGTKAWEFPVGMLAASSPVVGADSTVYIGGWSYISSQYRIKLYAIHPDGTEKWRFPKSGDPEKYGAQLANPVIGADNNIYFGFHTSSYAGGDGRLYALRPDGTPLWSNPPSLGAIGNSPAVIAPDGTLYVGTGEGYTNMFRGKLYAVNTTAFGVANTAWPMRGHDPQRLSRFTGFPACEIPVITTQAKDSIICEGDAVKLTVGATGTDLNYQWYKGLDKSTPVGAGESFITPDLIETTIYWVEVSNTCGSTNSRTATITTTITGLTESSSGMFEVKTYPNPVTNKLTVESAQFKVMGSIVFVYDFYGRKIFEKYIAAGTERMEIDLSRLGSGMYFCRIVSKGFNVVKKVIKT
ncbi:MAG: PQQ-binding-like beta-propeller repeat protein [Bacteroidales bacterium]|nr:PQQ-binding-like beta-propeller repeat protein [Bacteroidales bacterium]